MGRPLFYDRHNRVQRLVVPALPIATIPLVGCYYTHWGYMLYSRLVMCCRSRIQKAGLKRTVEGNQSAPIVFHFKMAATAFHAFFHVFEAVAKLPQLVFINTNTIVVYQ